MSLGRAAFLACFLGAAPQEVPLQEILRSASGPGGLCVLLGMGDGTVAAPVAESGAWIVHALEADEGRLRAARQAIEARGLSGQVAVEPWSAPVLPYQDHLANLVVAENPGKVPEAEILRVLAPGGTAWVRRKEGWAALRKAKPAEFDEWTHGRHGADGNMVSRDRAVAAPTGLRWVAGPAQDAAGKKWYYDHILVSAEGRNFYVTEDGIVARDAYNGSLLWTLGLKAPGVRETGTPVPPDAPPGPRMRLGTRISRVRPVASGDRLFAAFDGKLRELDGRTGQTAWEIGETKEPREILADGGLLILAEARSIRAWEAAGRKKAWEIALEARKIVAGDGGLFAVTASHVVGLDRATGKELWRTADPEAPLILTATYQGGILVLEKSTLRDDPVGCGIRVYSGADGKLLWTRDYKPDMTHYREARAYFARGLLWIQSERDRILGLDPKTGSEEKRWTSRGKHCATPVASERFFMAPECEFTDLETGQVTRSRIFKAACRLPFIPANGLLYTFPVQCECYPMLRGYMGLSSAGPGEIASGPRRQGSPAGAAPALLLRPEERAAEWPTYRHDVWRSGATPAALKRADVKVAWEAPVARPPEGPLASEWGANPFVRGVLTPPVAAGGTVFVAAPDRHRVTALDARSGKVRWSFAAGGRIDGPPTLHEGLCLFGAHDGWVYAVRAADGELAWRLRAAPREARLPAYGQIESPWPVVASVLVEGDRGYVAAGRHPSADGGVRVLAFGARTGEVVWDKTIDQLEPIKAWYGGTLPDSKIKLGLDFEPVDLLVRDGDRVAMSRWRFDPATGDSRMALDSVTYPGPGGLAVPRGIWGYGIRQTKMVASRPPAAFDAGGIRAGATGDAAVILAGGTLVAASAKGDLRVGDRSMDLGAEPVFDGMIAAYGALYIATRKGTVLCLE
jgi:outer membrane protein assembly factor BamB